jgi:hypothetical protein
MYKIPEEYYFRIHHIRPRFKNNVEDVLYFMANEIAKIEPSEHIVFKEKLNTIIKLYPGNSSRSLKTINNWRTEISALFGLVEYDGELSKPSRMSLLLSQSQDLVEFFRYFLYYFQYPGGHLKPAETLEYIKAGIKFKPASYILSVLMEGRKITNNEKFGVTKAEATHCIFNDLRVTRDNQTPQETVKIIIENRKNNVEYDQGGDITRYAGDILDYMELADLVTLRPNYNYYPNLVNLETIQAYINSSTYYFEPYEAIYREQSKNLANVTKTQNLWFHYVNNKLETSIFQANILSIIEGSEEETPSMDFLKQILSKLQTSIESAQGIKTKEIGDVGESVVIEHEKIRLIKLDRNDVLHLIKKIPETFAVGYDISSYDGVGDLRRYIEVKTTISRGKLASNSFHMTPSEWSSASTLRLNYFVYRLMISSSGVNLFLIKDPVGKYKEDLLDMIPREGADIRYSEKSGYWEPLLV